MIFIGDFSDKSKATSARNRLLREMTQFLREGRKKTELEKLVTLFDQRDYNMYGHIAWR